MQERHQNRELYFREQVYTTAKYVIPFIEKHLTVDENTVVMEVGCGEGGNIQPFLDRGCRVTGVDISAAKIDHARIFLGKHKNQSRLTLIADDVYNLENRFTGTFDLIFLRDVVEHIHDQEKFMGFIKNFLKQGGLMFLGFPPWHNPFGGHQQVCENRILSKLPYIHLLPGFLYKGLLKLGGESHLKINSLMEVRETGISIDRFERILRRTGYAVEEKTLYFINPNYEIKFGLKPREQMRIIRSIPYLASLLSTSAYMLVAKNS